MQRKSVSLDSGINKDFISTISVTNGQSNRRNNVSSSIVTYYYIVQYICKLELKAMGMFLLKYLGTYLNYYVEI